jgi:hypothetical protein
MASTLAPKPDPGPGHNVDEAAQFRVYVADLTAIDEKIASLKAVRNKLRKTAKANGIELKLADAIIRLADWEPEEIKQRFAVTEAYARFMGLPVGTQPSLFDDERLPDVERDRAKWDARGFSDGVRGIGWPDKPPVECHQDCAQSYGAGWERGQAQLQDDRLKATAA